jgi:hypothetical protein
VQKPLNPLEQPLTARRALALAGIIGLVALMAFAAPRAWRWWAGRPKSVPQQQQVVRNYLEKKSGQDELQSSYDFELRRTVATLQSNAVQLRAEVNLAHTNLARLDKEARALTREAAAATEAERTAKRQLTGITEKLSEQQRRLSTRQGELGLAQSNVTAMATNPSPDVARTAARMEKLQKQVTAAQEALASVQTNVTALEQHRREAEGIFTTRHTAAEAKRAELAARQAELKAQQATLASQEKALQALRRESSAKEQALGSQGNDFARTMRKNIKEAGSYEAIYAAIGQLVWTGERLLALDEPRVQRQGAQFIDEAAQAASRDAEDAWLAARICEAWVWPNLTRYDLPGQGTTAADAVLGNCNGIFQRAGETNLVERNYRLMLQHAPTRRRADAVRYNLGYLLEESGAWPAALEVYGEIQDTNYVAQAQRRMAVVEQKRTKAP